MKMTYRLNVKDPRFSKDLRSPDSGPNVYYWTLGGDDPGSGLTVLIDGYDNPTYVDEERTRWRAIFPCIRMVEDKLHLGPDRSVRKNTRDGYIERVFDPVEEADYDVYTIEFRLGMNGRDLRAMKYVNDSTIMNENLKSSEAINENALV